jgi:ParB family chromosome partitioning protein
MQVLIKDIIVRKRIRKDMKGIDELAESLRKHGQISPIVISRKNVLIAGGRRLEAANSLGWQTINAIILEDSNEVTRLEIEIEENTQRRDFSRDELSYATRRLYALQNPGFFRRIFNAIAGFFKRLFKAEDM